MEEAVETGVRNAFFRRYEEALEVFAEDDANPCVQSIAVGSIEEAGL